MCEGKNTEPAYLRSFTRDHSNDLVEIRVIPEGGAPVTLVGKAREEKHHLEQIAKKSGDSFDSRFQVWGVFDVDQHPNIPRAMQVARDNGIFLVISNPCVELWGMLHFAEHDAPIDRHAAQKRLAMLMPGYDPKKSKCFDYPSMRASFDIAVDRARRMCERRLDERDPAGNPSTNMYKLLKAIQIGGKVHGRK